MHISIQFTIQRYLILLILMECLCKLNFVVNVLLKQYQPAGLFLEMRTAPAVIVSLLSNVYLLSILQLPFLVIKDKTLWVIKTSLHAKPWFAVTVSLPLISCHSSSSLQALGVNPVTACGGLRCYRNYVTSPESVYCRFTPLCWYPVPFTIGSELQ